MTTNIEFESGWSYAGRIVWRIARYTGWFLLWSVWGPFFVTGVVILWIAGIIAKMVS